MISLNSPIIQSEAARYMGVKGEPDEAVMDSLTACEEMVRKTCAQITSTGKSVDFTEDGVVAV